MTSPDPHTLTGLRRAELDPHEQVQLDAVLADDPRAREDHAFAHALGDALQESADVEASAPSAADILALAAARSTERPTHDAPPPRLAGWNRPVLWAVAAAALVGLGAASLGMWGDDASAPDLRPRGDVLPDAEVHLEAVADGPDVRSLSNGAVLDRSEAVVFHVTASRPGTVTLAEHGPGGSVPILTWSAEAGRHPLTQNGAPVAWTPDDGAGVRRYIVEWCAVGGDPCVTDALELRWEGAR